MNVHDIRQTVNDVLRQLDLEKEIQYDGKVYIVRLGNGGVEVTEKGQPWPEQYLVYSNVIGLVTMKNEALERCGGDRDKGELAWREDVAKRIFGK